MTLGNLVSFAIVAGSLYWFDADPKVLFFVYLLTTFAQLVQIRVFWRLARRPRAPDLLLKWTRPPTENERARAKSSLAQETAAKSFFDFSLLWGVLTLFAFMLLHVNRYKELDFELFVFAKQMTLAVALTVVYVVESLVAGETPMDFEEPEALNFHYSSRRFAVLAFAVLTGGAVVVWFQMTGREVSPWALTGPLLIWKHGFDLRRRGPAPG